MTPFSHSPPQPSTMNHATLCSGTTLECSLLLLWLTPFPPSSVFSPQAGLPMPTPHPELSSVSSQSSARSPRRHSSPELLLLLLSTFYFCPELGQFWCCCFWTNIFWFQLSSNSLAIYAYSFQKTVSPYVFTYLFYLYYIPNVHSILMKSRTACYPYLCQYY